MIITEYNEKVTVRAMLIDILEAVMLGNSYTNPDGLRNCAQVNGGRYIYKGGVMDLIGKLKSGATLEDICT